MKRPFVVPLLVVLSLALLAVVSLARKSSSPAPAAASGCEPGALVRLTVDQARPHRVATDTQTSFVLRLTNYGQEPVNGQAYIADVSSGWTAVLSLADGQFRPTTPGQGVLIFTDLGPGQSRDFLAIVLPDPGVPEGTQGSVQVNTALSDGQLGCTSFAAEVNNDPKLFVVGIDGFSVNYLYIGRDGTGDPGNDNWLTPRLRQLVGQSAWFPQGRASLPSSTDMNVFGALSGSWPGTAGISSVATYFKGWDAEDNPVTGSVYADDLRYGPTGERALSVFDVSQDPAYGGDPDLFTAMISGKFQTDALFQLGGAYTADLVVDGEVFPSYLTPPEPYLLGDPPSDPNAATDRDGVNLYPQEEYRMISYWVGLAGNNPERNPEDRWIDDSALRMLAAEDPDILVVHFASTDKIHHGAGAANIPSEWSDNGTPGLIWDDINLFNRNANREPVLDVVAEVDYDTGMIVDELTRRGVFDRSHFVLYSDHSGITYHNEDIPLEQVMADAGVLDKVHYYSGAAEISTIYLHDPADAGEVADALEAYQTVHPVWDTPVEPLAAITQAEMDAGMDSRLGWLGREGGPSRGEMYSQWLIEFPVEDNSKVVWPDIYVLGRYRYEISVPHIAYSVLGGHSGKTTMGTLYALRGPQINPGVYTGTDPALVDLMPTIYHLRGWTAPGNVDGVVLSSILSPP